jgi:hypothetical protein
MQQGCLASADEFVERNNATFVTFNYDRTLEHFFYHRLLYTYDIKPAEALEKLKEIPIIHVYGSLGNFHDSILAKQSFTPPEIQAAATSIRLMYDDRREHPEIEKAKAAISGASIVCFLGFSFDPDNLALLEMQDRCSGKTIFASRYLMPDGDWGRAVANLAGGVIQQAERGWDALKFLQETRALG